MNKSDKKSVPRWGDHTMSVINEDEADDDYKPPTPPEGYDWGEKTKQAVASKPERAPKYLRSDWEEIQDYFGIPSFENNFEYQNLYPDCIIHERKADETRSAGGTDFLCCGKPGTGKTTLALYFAARLMEVNDEINVWRGTPGRSEWLPYRKWTRLFLPANADIEAAWQPIDRRKDKEPVDVEDTVREVIYYENLRDLNRQLRRGTFNVVYPDPSFSGCTEVMRESTRSRDFEYVSQKQAGEDEKPTPTIHWWFAWMVSRIEHGPFEFTSLFFDEVGDLFPADARNDAHDHYQKITTFKDAMVDARKHDLSLYFFGHDEADLHPMLKRKIRWRIAMPSEANPTTGDSVVGYNKIPMRTELTLRYPIGKALFWNEVNWEPFKWTDVPRMPEDKDRWLKIEVKA